MPTSRREALTDGQNAVPVLEIHLPSGPEAPATARAAITGLCQDLPMVCAQRETLLLLVSELVTNAVRHSQAPPEAMIGLRACLRSERVHIAVTDEGVGFTPAPRDTRRSGGYGLYLLRKAAARWGVDDVGGTRVWFELPLSSWPCAGSTPSRASV